MTAQVLTLNNKPSFLKNKKIVFTNGCFDILHAGHTSLLYQARKLGDILIVGLNSDKSIKKLKSKGDQRPIFNEWERVSLLSLTDLVDYIILFDELTPIKVIERLKPDVLVKGGDWRIEEIVGSNIVKETRIIKLIPNLSTSIIINKIKDKLIL